MADVFHCSDSSQLLSGMRAARQAIGRGELVVLPTDTVYGVGADAFTPEAVTRLLQAKGRGRQSPPPVLIPNTETLGALAAEVTEPLQILADTFWPGPLTIITRANPSLDWDLGETGGTVALRIPDRQIALELLRETGPLAVSSANTSGQPAAVTVAEAQEMLGDSVTVYLDDDAADGESSTIIDVTNLSADGSGTVRIMREGGVTLEALQQALPDATVTDRVEPEQPLEAPQDVTEQDTTEPDTSGQVASDGRDDGGSTERTAASDTDASDTVEERGA